MTENKDRTPEQIEAELKAARDRLAENIDGLVSDIDPSAAINRTIDKAKDAVDTAKDKAKDAVGQAKEAVSQLKDKTAEAYAAARERAESTFGEDKVQQATEMFNSAKENADVAFGKAKDAVLDNDGRLNDLGKKVLIGAGAAVAGLVVLISWINLKK